MFLLSLKTMVFGKKLLWYDYVDILAYNSIYVG